MPADYDVQIRALRRARGLSQAQLATLVGAAHKAVVYQWEARKRTPPEKPIADFGALGEFTVPLCCDESADTQRRQPWQ